MRPQASRSKPVGQSKLNLPFEERLADEARLFLSWLDNPAIAGAISPSGRQLARAMARSVDPASTGPVIELGPGTGVITEALLARGIARDRLCLVEYDPGFCSLLARRFPGVRIVQGDAYRLVESLGPILDVPAAAVVSSLPLLMKPEPARIALLAEAFALLAPEGRFVQFTYGPLSPVPRTKKAGLSFHAHASPPVWLNLPPARVWIYRRCTAEEEACDAERGQIEDIFVRLRAGTERFPREFKKEFEDAKARLGLSLQARQAWHKNLTLEPALRILRNLPDFNKPRRPQ